MKKKYLFIDLGTTRGELNEPLGIECISSRIIRELPVHIDLLWCDIEQPYLPDLLSYDFIGLSMSIGSLERFKEIYYFLRNRKPELPLVVGGCIPTFAYPDLLKKYDNIICSFGEGEGSIWELAKLSYEYGLSINRRLLSIPNLAFMLDGNIIITSFQSVDLMAQSPIVRNHRFLDAIRDKHGIVRLEGSRGCSWNRCSCCCVNAEYANPMWRPFPLHKIISELEELSELGFSSPYFTDEDFFGNNYARSIELANQIIALKRCDRINKRMGFFISILAVDAVNREGQEALLAWKEAGLREVYIGIESFDQAQLKRFGKKANADINRKALEFVDSIGLQIDSGYILFDPLISFDDLGTSLNYIQSLKLNRLDSRSCKRLRLEPMTTISTEMGGTITDELDVNNLEYPYVFQDAKVGEVYRLYKKWEDMNAKDVWIIQAASRGEVDEAVRVQIKTILKQIRDVDFQTLRNIFNYCANKSKIPFEYSYSFKEKKADLVCKGMEFVHSLTK